MKINHRPITEQLEAIRRQVGGEPFAFTPPPFPQRSDADRDLTTVAEVRALFHPSGILVDETGHPVFVYIRDHTGWSYSDDPAERNKVHLVQCETLVSMEKGGKIRKYRQTRRTSNKYIVDVKAGWFRSKTLDGQTLYICRKCLAATGYKGFNFDMPKEQKAQIVRNADAKDAYRLARSILNDYRRKAGELPPDSVSGAYPPDWNEISGRFRKSKNYICEYPDSRIKGVGCGVDLSKYPGCTDAHHDDTDKSNCLDDNLRCLCKLCHAKVHYPRYVVSDKCRNIIMEERAQQGLPPD